MDTTHEISQLLQHFPNGKGLFEDIKAKCSPDSVGFRILCPTRWTVPNETSHSIMETYDALLQLWETMLDDLLDSEVRASVNGVVSQMKTLDCFFGACFHYSLLRHMDNFSKTMQHTKTSAMEAQHLARMTIANLLVNCMIISQ